MNESNITCRADQPSAGVARNPAVRRYSAFTLVELLVVIGIIALLISILLPSLNKARQSASNLQCMSNLRQIGLGMSLYVQENKGWIPRYNDFSARPAWYHKLIDTGVIGEGKVLMCPDRTEERIVAPATTELESMLQEGTISYGINMNYAYAPPVKINQIVNATQKIMAVDAFFTPEDPKGSYYVFDYPRSAGGQAMPRHPNRGANVLWVDGHVTSAHGTPEGYMYSATGLTTNLHEPNYWSVE